MVKNDESNTGSALDKRCQALLNPCQRNVFFSRWYFFQTMPKHGVALTTGGSEDMIRDA